MALPDRNKIVVGTPLVFANTGEYSPTLDPGQPTGVNADIDLNGTGTGLASGAYRQSEKLDLGSASLDVEWVMKAYIEFHSAPVAGGLVNFFLGFSNDATAGEDNPGNLSGTDAAYNGYGAAATDADEAILQLDYIGSLPVTADIDLQVKTIGLFIPRFRYCCLVVHNGTSVAIAGTDAIETAVAIWPRELQLQD